MNGWSKKRIPLRFAEGFQFQGDFPVQEDYFELNPERGIFVLADGFGGNLGKQAAELAVKSIRSFMEQEAGDLDATLPFELRPYYSLAGNVLLNAISFANQKILEMNRERSWEDSGGSSVIAGYLEGRLLSVAQVGTCKMFLRRGSGMKQVVHPKSLMSQVNPFDDEGEGDSVPLMSLGTAKRLEPEITEVELKLGDQIFLETAGVRNAIRQKLSLLNSPSELSHFIDENQQQIQTNASIIWLAF